MCQHRTKLLRSILSLQRCKPISLGYKHEADSLYPLGSPLQSGRAECWCSRQGCPA